MCYIDVIFSCLYDVYRTENVYNISLLENYILHKILQKLMI